MPHMYDSHSRDANPHHVCYLPHSTRTPAQHDARDVSAVFNSDERTPTGDAPVRDDAADGWAPLAPSRGNLCRESSLSG